MRPARTLDEVRTQFEQISEQATALIRPIDAATLNKRPKPDSWSVAECFAHLNLSADAFFPEWERAIAAAPPRDPAKPLKLDLWGRLLIWSIEPPPRFRFPTPPGFVPVDTGAIEDLLPGFLRRQSRILEFVKASEGKAIEQAKVVSPFNARLSYTVWSSFCINASHERRHLWQAERAVQSMSLR